MHPHVRATRTTRRALLAVLSLALSCDASPAGCGADPMNAPTEPSWRPSQRVPDDVDAVVFFPELSGLARALSAARDTLPSSLGLYDVCAASSAQLSLDTCDVGAWARAGFDLQAPAAAALDGQRLVFLARRRRLDVPLPSAAEGAHVMALGEGAALALAPRSVLASWVLPGVVPPPTPPWHARWSSLLPTHSWAADPVHRELRDALIPHGPFYAVARPGPWLARYPASSMLASDLLTRMTRQSGRVGVVGRLELSGAIRLRVLTSLDMGAPSVVDGLGRARGPLPRLGGLIEPGVLGVLRVSLDPVAAFELMRSGLAASERDQLEALFTALERDFALDVERAVVSNLIGHAVVVVYGLTLPDEPPASFTAFALELLAGNLTHEAVFVPIEDRDRLALFLDALTQISRGRLARQRRDDVLEYAWFDARGALRGGALLTPTHLVLVDSAVAFNHAASHARAPTDLAPSLSRLGLDRLLEGDERSGLYVDVDALETLLRPGDLEVMGEWLAPLDRLTLVTRETSPFGITDITLEPADDP